MLRTIQVTMLVSFVKSEKKRRKNAQMFCHLPKSRISDHDPLRYSQSGVSAPLLTNGADQKSLIWGDDVCLLFVFHYVHILFVLIMFICHILEDDHFLQIKNLLFQYRKPDTEPLAQNVRYETLM